ncbi:MAG: alpha/beta fold hydrolase, partial [Bradymonadia bacterium]
MTKILHPRLWQLCLLSLSMVGCGSDQTTASETDCRSVGNACAAGLSCRLQNDGQYQCVARVDDLDAAVEQGDVAVPERDGQSLNVDAEDAPDGGSLDLGATRDMGLDSDGGVPDAGDRDAASQSSFPSGISRNLEIDGHPGRVFDVYMPTIGPRQVVIFLHGGAGSKEGSADHLRLSGISQEALDETGTAWILPQGANANVSGTPTWTNYVMDSGYRGPNGEDDVAFLIELARWGLAQLGSDTVALGGHSNGGMMTHRMWCEADDPFDRFVSVAGPPSAEFNPNDISPRECRGSKPYWAILGTEDGVLKNQDLDAEIWTIAPAAQNEAFLNPNLLNERFAHNALRRVAVCPDNTAVREREDGARLVYSSCGARLRVWFIRPPRGERIRGVGQHPISTLEEHGGFTI